MEMIKEVYVILVESVKIWKRKLVVCIESYELFSFFQGNINGYKNERYKKGRKRGEKEENYKGKLDNLKSIRRLPSTPPLC